ncbi:MAG: zinc ribbon domain-containing protein [Methanobacterium sp.]
MVFCTKCGTENEDIAAYCSECGQKLQIISNDKSEPQVTTQGEKELLQEMINVAWKTGYNRKTLYFTDKNIYVAEGSFLTGGMGFAFGGIIGHYVEKKSLSDREKAARTMNFKEMAAENPNVIIIPYNEIINVEMGKKRMLLAPSIKVETTSDDYTFTVMDFNKYKQFQQSIPLILGDKVTVK